MQTMTVDTIYQQYIEPLSHTEQHQLIKTIQQFLGNYIQIYVDDIHQTVFEALHEARMPHDVQKVVEQYPEMTDVHFLTVIEYLISQHVPKQNQSRLINMLHWAIITLLNERIEQAKQINQTYEEKYGMTYHDFYHAVAIDEALLDKLDNANIIWELDINTWEFYAEGLPEWSGRLEDILKHS
ncbi:hypothetical protein QUF58_01430 [Anaerolineales bacterium HSG24]|nr:hypothetical protein [Anaerolineales bacterium HSG24]